jgi:hypothetical protein
MGLAEIQCFTYRLLRRKGGGELWLTLYVAGFCVLGVRLLNIIELYTLGLVPGAIAEP